MAGFRTPGRSMTPPLSIHPAENCNRGERELAAATRGGGSFSRSSGRGSSFNRSSEGVVVSVMLAGVDVIFSHSCGVWALFSVILAGIRVKVSHSSGYTR